MNYLAIGMAFVGALLCTSTAATLSAKVPKQVSAIYAPFPDYPRAARSRREQGKGLFVVRVHIKSGHVKDVYVARTTGYRDLDAATVAALKQWRFKPGALVPISKILPDRKDPFAAEDSLAKVPVTFEMTR